MSADRGTRVMGAAVGVNRQLARYRTWLPISDRECKTKIKKNHNKYVDKPEFQKQNTDQVSNVWRER